jgi:2-hydroxy-6-oxonona-2,4-dienedioate hydrolase
LSDSKIIQQCAAFLLGGAWLSTGLTAGVCSIDHNRLDQGEKSPFMICGKDIPKNFALDGLDETGIVVDYAQWVRKCAPDRKERGIYLWLSAGKDALPASIGIRNPETGEQVCSGLAIDVPATQRLGDATLSPIRYPDGNAYRLDIEAGKSGRLDEACSGGLEFPRSPQWPEISLLSRQEVATISMESGQFGPSQWYSLPNSTSRRKRAPVEPLNCDKKRLTAYVRVTGQQRFPAKVVVSDLGGKQQGQVGLAYVSLPEPDWAKSMRDKDAEYIDVNGYRTRYFKKGSGPDTIILVHGGQPDPMSPTAQFWKQNFDALANKFRVIAYDNLGHGYTDNPRTQEDYETYYERSADHLYDFIQALELQRVHLVGHSQGGWPVMRVALDHPEIVSCVVSVATGLAPMDRGAAGVRNFAYLLTSIMPPDGPTVESLYREREFMGYTRNNLMWSDMQRRYKLSQRPELKEGRDALAALRMSPGHPYFQGLRAGALEELAAGKLRVPHLVVWGRNDPMADYDAGLNFFDIAAASDARTELRVINHAGHSPMVEYPEIFNEAVTGFCGDYQSQLN